MAAGKKQYTVRFDSLSNKWQVKVRQQPGGPGTEPMWFDAGDPCDTMQEAIDKQREFEREATE